MLRQEPMDGEIGEIHQIDGLTVSHDKERECAIVETWHKEQVCALGLIFERTLHLDERASAFVD